MRKFKIWYFTNISANISIALISFFFSASLTMFAVFYNQYNIEHIENLYNKRSSELDSIAENTERDVYKLTKMVSFKQVQDSVFKRNSKQLDVLLKSVAFYNRKGKRMDSSKYYARELKSINTLLPFDIGKLQAYSGIDLQERGAEYEINLRYINSQYQLSKSLENYFRHKIKKNDKIEDQISDLIINASAQHQYYKDTLNSRPTILRTLKREKNDKQFDKRVAHFKFNQRFYLLLSYVCVIIAIILSYFAYICGHFRRN